MEKAYFLAPILIGGIAALTLTGNAFQRPQKIIEKYKEDLDRIFLRREDLSEEDKQNIPDAVGVRISTKNKSDIFYLDVWEIGAMALYILAEFCILGLFFITSETERVTTPSENILLTAGYLFLVSGIVIVAAVHFWVIYCCSRQPGGGPGGGIQSIEETETMTRNIANLPSDQFNDIEQEFVGNP